MDTTGIQISCINNRNLYLYYRNSNDSKLKEHYKLYCKILLKLLKITLYKTILNSKNETKITWNIVKSETG
jgi:hypothetical protein